VGDTPADGEPLEVVGVHAAVDLRLRVLLILLRLLCGCGTGGGLLLVQSAQRIVLGHGRAGRDSEG